MPNAALTKTAIATAYKELLQENPANKITVQNIVDRCGLNRQTFYYHFADIYDLIGWIYDEEALNAIRRQPGVTWQSGLQAILAYMEENKVFCLRTLHSFSREHLERFLRMESRDLLLRILRNVAEQKGIEDAHEEDIQFIAQFYEPSLIEYLIGWASNGMRESPEEVIEKLDLLLSDGVALALRRLSQRRKRPAATPDDR